MINLSKTPIFATALTSAINEVLLAASAENISPDNFSIDESACDFGQIKVAGVVSVISGFAGMLGDLGSDNYNYSAGELCEAVSAHFAKEKTSVKDNDIVGIYLLRRVNANVDERIQYTVNKTKWNNLISEGVSNDQALRDISLDNDTVVVSSSSEVDEHLTDIEREVSVE